MLLFSLFVIIIVVIILISNISLLNRNSVLRSEYISCLILFILFSLYMWIVVIVLLLFLYSTVLYVSVMIISILIGTRLVFSSGWWDVFRFNHQINNINYYKNYLQSHVTNNRFRKCRTTLNNIRDRISGNTNNYSLRRGNSHLISICYYDAKSKHVSSTRRKN